MTLVTGGAGFIGSHVVKALQGPVFVADLQAAEPIDLRTANIQALLHGVKPSLIIHLAGHAIVAESVADPMRDHETNLVLTLRLLEAVRAVCPETRLLYASTGAVYGNQAERPFTETDATFPVPPYAVSKLASERYCASYAAMYGMRTASLRLFSVFGPGQRKQVVYDLIRKVLQNPARLEMHGDGSQVRDFNPAPNIADAFVLAAECAAFEGEVYNVAGPEALSIAQLAGRICGLIGATPELVYSGTTRKGDAERWLADMTKLRGLGYEPRMPLDEGLRETIQWVRDDLRRHTGL